MCSPSGMASLELRAFFLDLSAVTGACPKGAAAAGTGVPVGEVAAASSLNHNKSAQSMSGSVDRRSCCRSTLACDFEELQRVGARFGEGDERISQHTNLLSES
ncbi:hypothetical protein BCR44DRAFT_1436450 [Catenaria anguillulae PL171]|uniref:Uncharacterized protein n=1 Tax=Catenaria anguillulae PL171 TaxID=765915 RepID=A0A1Y2HIG0_9FUNG|nr:hypothetical protein BCR44DRAFT_1436450 [Catenaria anguillulae PL171]